MNLIDGLPGEPYSSEYWSGEFMGTVTSDKTGSIVVSALRARANFGKLLDRFAEDLREEIRQINANS
jgi:hypothetical protein